MTWRKEDIVGYYDGRRPITKPGAKPINMEPNKDCDIAKNEEDGAEFKRREIEQQRQHKTSEKNLEKLRQELADKLFEGNSYMLSDEYKELSKEEQKYLAESERLAERATELESIIEKHKTIKHEKAHATLPPNLARMMDKPDEVGERAIAELKHVKELQKSTQEKYMSAFHARKKFEEPYLGNTKVDESTVSTKVKDSYRGFEKDTHVTLYQGLYERGHAQIVEMSPKTYLQFCGRFFGSSYERQVRAMIAEADVVHDLMTKMKNGTKMYMPYLNFRTNQQEGRHRAAAAVMLGIDRIPVMVVLKPGRKL